MHLPPAIILDADLVLIDYAEQFRRYMETEHGIPSAVPWSQETDYGMTRMYPGLSCPIRVYIEKMALDAEYYGSIPPMDGALEGVRGLRELFPGVPVVCVTSGGAGAKTRSMRIENLLPFELDEIVTLPLDASKSDAFKAYASGCWLVDDLPQHVRSAEEAGHKGILFDQPHNRANAGLCRACGWQGVLRIMAREPLTVPVFV